MKKTTIIAMVLITFFMNAQSPVEINGALSVKGNQIVNSKGNPVSFAGNSFFWSEIELNRGDFYNKQVVKWLKDDWNTTIVRCALSLILK